MAGSTLPAVKTQLVAILDALDTDVTAYPAWPGENVVWGDRGGRDGSEPHRVEAIWLDSVTQGESEYVAMRAGTKRRQEIYSPVVNFACQDDSGDATLAVVETRVLTLFALFEAAIATTPTLAGADLASGQQILSAGVEEWELIVDEVESNGFAAVLAARLRIVARTL